MTFWYEMWAIFGGNEPLLPVITKYYITLAKICRANYWHSN